MADPKEGFNSGIDRLVISQVDSDGNITPDVTPKEGFNSPEKTVSVSIDASGHVIV